MKTIQVKVKPSARMSQLGEGDGGVWTAQLKSQPVNGKANAELISLVAMRFDCSKSVFSIKRGTMGRTK